jgi:hypothetical protein
MAGRHDDLHDDARRALALLERQPEVRIGELRDAGVSGPAQALYALQLAGWPLRRRGGVWRLVGPDEPAPPVAEPPPRVRRVARER